MPTDNTPASHDDDNDDVDGCSKDWEDEDLRPWYDGEWERHDHMPYVSGGATASFMDSEEPLFVGGKSIFALCVGGGTPTSLFDLEGEPLLIGGRSIFAEA